MAANFAGKGEIMLDSCCLYSLILHIYFTGKACWNLFNLLTIGFELTYYQMAV